MHFSFSDWISKNIDDYQSQLETLRIDYYLSEGPLLREECSLSQLRRFNDVCLTMADVCYAQGDDGSYFYVLLRLHQKLMLQLGDEVTRSPLFKAQTLQLARYSLTKLCQLFMQQGEWKKACALQDEYQRYADVTSQ